MNAIATITDFNLTKGQIDSLARNVLEELDEGYCNPLEIHIALKAMEELVKKIKDGIFDSVIGEAEKYGKEFTFRGAQIQLANRRTYDFSQDYTWCELDKSKKEREEMLRHLSNPVADPDTGEMIHPAAFKVSPYITTKLAP